MAFEQPTPAPSSPPWPWRTPRSMTSQVQTSDRPSISERLSQAAPLEIPHLGDAAHPWILAAVLSESPLHRAGCVVDLIYALHVIVLTPWLSLLQAYGSYASGSSTPRHTLAPHTQNTIRASTMQLSNLVIHPTAAPQGPLPTPDPTPHEPIEETVPSSLGTPSADLPLTPIVETPGKASPPSPTSPSGLSLLIAREREAVSKTGSSPTAIDSSSSRDREQTAAAEGAEHLGFGSDTPRSASLIDLSHECLLDGPPHVASEVTPLLARTPDGNGHLPTHFVPISRHQNLAKRVHFFLSESRKSKNIKNVVSTAIKSIPAVMLGSLLNILDGVSCGYTIALTFRRLNLVFFLI
jgi:hypothetical protein